MGRIGRGPNSHGGAPAADLRKRLAAKMEITASENHIIPDRNGAHSLRSGGDNAILVEGYCADVIRRRDRLRSDSSSPYLLSDDGVSTTVWQGISGAEGSLPQLQLQAVGDLHRGCVRPNGWAGGKGETLRGDLSIIDRCECRWKYPGYADAAIQWGDNRTVVHL